MVRMVGSIQRVSVQVTFEQTHKQCHVGEGQGGLMEEAHGHVCISMEIVNPEKKIFMIYG